MAQKRERIRVRTLKVLELVQKGTARAEQTGDEMLKDKCTSLLSAVMPLDIKNEFVSIPADPHQQQVSEINNAISQGAAA